VGHGYRAAGGVIYRYRGEVLDEGSSTPYVQGLGPEADGEERLVEVMGVLNQELVYVLARRVGGIALRDRVLAVFLRIHVCRGTGKEDSLAGIDQIGCFARRGVKRNLHRLAAGLADGFCVLGPGAGVVLRIRAGRDRNSDARLHTRP
jgi:hypothetical protein